MINDKRTSEWDFWKFALGLGAVVIPIVVLYLAARSGDVISTVILGCLVALVLLFLGGLAVLFILHKRNEWEQVRFQANAQENLQLLQQSQRLLSQQALGQARTSRALGAQLRNVDMLLGDPEPERPVMDVSAIAWDADLDQVAEQWQDQAGQR